MASGSPAPLLPLPGHDPPAASLHVPTLKPAPHPAPRPPPPPFSTARAPRRRPGPMSKRRTSPAVPRASPPTARLPRLGAPSLLLHVVGNRTASSCHHTSRNARFHRAPALASNLPPPRTLARAAPLRARALSYVAISPAFTLSRPPLRLHVARFGTRSGTGAVLVL